MKHEWRKSEALWYLPPSHPVEVEVPEFSYFMISGEGDPDSTAFQQAVETLYAVSYGVRMSAKAGVELPGFQEYTVYPLEGVWDLSAAPQPGAELDRDALVWQAMIRQPDFLSADAAEQVVAAASEKKALPAASHVAFQRIADGKCVQMLHLGPFGAESASFAEMDRYCLRASLARVGHAHREIYLSDPRRTAPEKLKTVLRYPVRDDYSCV